MLNLHDRLELRGAAVGHVRGLGGRLLVLDALRRLHRLLIFMLLHHVIVQQHVFDRLARLVVDSARVCRSARRRRALHLVVKDQRAVGI